jgi:hypothetical protein
MAFVKSEISFHNYQPGKSITQPTTIFASSNGSLIIIWLDSLIDPSKRAINLSSFNLKIELCICRGCFFRNFSSIMIQPAKSKNHSNDDCDIYGDALEKSNCDGNFTSSGSNPPKTVGPLSRLHDRFAKYAPCGHWSTCSDDCCKLKKHFDATRCCSNRGENKSPFEVVHSYSMLSL